MAERIITVGSTHGLHARPAKLFVEAVGASGAKVSLSKEGGRTVDAGSILGVISLGIDHGDKIVLTTDAAYRPRIKERPANPAWDVLAGAVLVAEAGGAVTTIAGGEFDPFRTDVCATNGKVQAELLGVLDGSGV